METFRDRFRYCLRLRRLTQKQIAYKLGVSRQTVSFWATETHSMNMQNVIDLAATLDVTIDWLLTGEGPMVRKRRLRAFFTFCATLTLPDSNWRQEPKQYSMYLGTL